MLALTPTSALLLHRHQSYQDTRSLTRLLKASGNERPARGLGLLTPSSVVFPSCFGFLDYATLHVQQVPESLSGAHTSPGPKNDLVPVSIKTIRREFCTPLYPWTWQKLNFSRRGLLDLDTQPRKLAICCTQNPGDCQSLGRQSRSQGKHPVDQLAVRYGGSQPGVSNSRPCLHGIVLPANTALCDFSSSH